MEPLCEGFAVRPMTADDLDAVLEVEAACYTNPWGRAIFARELNNAWASLELVVEAHAPELPVAHLVYWVVHDELHILNVATAPRFRRRGLASAMLRRLLAICRQQRLLYLTLEVRVGNEAAIALYQAFGFAPIGRRKNYYADNGEDALVMALVLTEEGEPGQTPPAVERPGGVGL
jgi:ribosomal-protein-alanine N-acetyltransferase